MHKAMLALTRVMALLGGAVLTLIILLVCVSVLGRALNGMLHGAWVQSVAPGFAQGLLDLGVGPITGDYELVEAGTAFAIFAFLPMCQITGGHASVDILTNRLPPRVRRILVMLGEVLFALVLLVITWRLYAGMISKMRYEETTFLLQFPVWWGYAASLAASVFAAITAIYVAALRIAEVLCNRDFLAEAEAP